MPRMVDLVRKSQLSSNMMQAAARGALMVPPAEMLEILVHLALHNKVFGELARMTLAGWDEQACQKVSADPATNKEVLDYLISPKNVRTALVGSLLQNPALKDEDFHELASTGSRAVVEAILAAPRVKTSHTLQDALRSNPRLRPNELLENLHSVPPQAPSVLPPVSVPVQPAVATPPAEQAPAKAEAFAAAEIPPAPETLESLAESPAEPGSESVPEEALAEALAKFLEENKAELDGDGNKPFQPIGGIPDSGSSSAAAEHAPGPISDAAQSAAVHHGSDKPDHLAGIQHARRPAAHHEERRDSTLQKIAKLDVKGRIHLAIRGGKEERSILIRDGTKLVALAVLDSPKVTDGEVEGFAQQKNVLEAVLRSIPLKRRFAKNYAITRNLVYNPRTPLDLSLGLMKNMLVHDLKNLSGNKEVSETIRKLALRMYKQKSEKKESSS